MSWRHLSVILALVDSAHKAAHRACSGILGIMSYVKRRKNPYVSIAYVEAFTPSIAKPLRWAALFMNAAQIALSSLSDCDGNILQYQGIR